MSTTVGPELANGTAGVMAIETGLVDSFKLLMKGSGAIAQVNICEPTQFLSQKTLPDYLSCPEKACTNR